jgi:hypothetical protein
LKCYSAALLLLVPFFFFQGCGKNPTSPISQTGDGWVCATDNAPWVGRYGLSGTVFGNSMWIVGGAAGDPAGSVTYWYGDVWSSGNGSSWSKATDCGPFGERFGSQVLSFNNQLWLIGGNNKGKLKNDVWSSSNGVSWSAATTNAGFSPREDFGAVVYMGKMWVVGGVATDGVKSDVWNSSDGATWNLVSNKGFPSRWGFAMTTFNGLWISGGVAIAPRPIQVSDIYRDVWTSTDGNTWTQLSAEDFSASNSYFHQVVVNNNQLWRTDGYYNGNLVRLIANSPDGITWTRDTGQLFLPRCGHLSLSYNNQVWVIGGINNYGGSLTCFNDVWHSP